MKRLVVMLMIVLCTAGVANAQLGNLGNKLKENVFAFKYLLIHFWIRFKRSEGGFITLVQNSPSVSTYLGLFLFLCPSESILYFMISP